MRSIEYWTAVVTWPMVLGFIAGTTLFDINAENSCRS